jgi:hypothetical protein
MMIYLEYLMLWPTFVLQAYDNLIIFIRKYTNLITAASYEAGA